MAMPAYMTVEGENQGPIEGSCDQGGHENEIIVEEFNHEITIPHDIQTGLPTAPRQHHEFVVTKFFDKSSPKLYQALTTGEHLKEVKLTWFRIDATGKQEHYFTIKLEDAVLVSINPMMANCLDPANGPFGHMEKAAFTYRKIIWTWETDGIESEDDWKAPVA